MKNEKVRKPRVVKLYFYLVGLMSVLTLVGCVTEPEVPTSYRPSISLNFLANGKTTKKQVFSTLGQPSGSFESGKILTYRLGYEPQYHSYYCVEREGRDTGWPTWSNASFSLVLVFSEAGILQKHSLVKVNQ